MRRLAVALLLLLPLTAGAQVEEEGPGFFGRLFGSGNDDDPGFIEGLIEDNLSTDGREVRIEGFDGRPEQPRHYCRVDDRR